MRTVTITSTMELDVLTAVKAIRAKCIDCCCGSRGEVARCHIMTCSLWPYRFGHRPVFAKPSLSPAPSDGDAA